MFASVVGDQPSRQRHRPSVGRFVMKIWFPLSTLGNLFLQCQYMRAQICIPEWMILTQMKWEDGETDRKFLAHKSMWMTGKTKTNGPTE
jgi:hypothetical protein